MKKLTSANKPTGYRIYGIIQLVRKDTSWTEKSMDRNTIKESTEISNLILRD